MHRIIVATLFAALAGMSTIASAGIIEQKAFKSEALGRDYAYTIFLPDGYSEERSRTYPVLYLLHGANGTETEWLEKGRADRTVQALIDAKEIPPLVVVMPGHKAGWWVDGAKEKGETALINELIPTIESTYRVSKEKTGRFIAGSSAGGFAVARFVLKYPEKFAAGAALSPAVYVKEPPATSSARRQHPFANASGEFDKTRWQQLNYPPLIEQYKRQPVRVPLYINSGDHDRFDIAPEAMLLYQEMRSIQPGQVELRVVDGDHEWPVWESTLGDALKYLTRTLTVTEPRVKVATP